MKGNRWPVIAMAGFVSMVAFRANAEECAGPGDISADGEVSLIDHYRWATCFAGPGETDPPSLCTNLDFQRSDMNHNAVVDLRDFVQFLDRFGDVYLYYGPEREDTEVELLAMAVSGALRAPDATYQRILVDLQAIRAEFSELATVIDDPDYVPTELIVDLIPGQSLGEYKELNRFYLLENESTLFGNTLILTFCGHLNVPVLAQVYSQLAAVNYAEQNGYFGHDDQITVLPLGETMRYSIDDGFLDCFDGCDCHRLWEIDVYENGEVTLVSYEEQGMPWCDF